MDGNYKKSVPSVPSVPKCQVSKENKKNREIYYLWGFLFFNEYWRSGEVGELNNKRQRSLSWDKFDKFILFRIEK